MWAILGDRVGDNNSVLALANALDINFTTKVIKFNNRAILNSLMFIKTLSGINNPEIISEPYPSIVISSGIKNEPIVRYIKKKSPKTKVIYIGRTWSNTKHFDLIISTPQYRISGNNVKVFPLPPIPVTKVIDNKKITPALQPNIFVSIGGNSGPHVLNEDSTFNMMYEITSYALSKNATLYVSTSARTPTNVIPIIKSMLTDYDYFYEWKTNNISNPYWQWISSADELIVTSDSVSMLADMVSSMKPVYVYNINLANKKYGNGYIKSFCHNLLIKYGPKRFSKNIQLVIDNLIDLNLISMFGYKYNLHKKPFIKDNINEMVEFVRSNI